MAQFNLAENLNPLVSTGGDSKSQQLFPHLQKSIQNAISIDIIVSFLMESGVKLLIKDLKEVVSKGIKIRLLTGNYLGITQPQALYLAKRELGKNLDIRFYSDQKRSFHPKAYFFHQKDFSELYVGSSNISYSALTNGIEWNYCLNSNLDSKSYSIFFAEFENLFYNHAIYIDDEVLENYSKTYHRSPIQNQIDETEELYKKNIFSFKPEPRGAQIEALYALEDSRMQGQNKALIHAATGIGKTYLSAFDSLNFKKVLFIAHREEILNQAYESFLIIRGHNSKMGFFNGKIKETDCNVIFASVETLGQKKYLTEEYFSKDYFDYLIIDEFHHAVTQNYKNILEYFSPKFTLGLTATPDRMDGKDIYELLDYNVPYEITLQEAINKGQLAPFHYYGIYDETDYSAMNFSRGHYDENDLNFAFINNAHRSNLILKHFKKYNSNSALGFCASRKHAEYMAKYFSENGIPSFAVYSGEAGNYSLDRKTAVEYLSKRKIRVLFTVDMFNEGVDIPNVDLVMFLRPTESPTVFLQQLGRGLRKSRGKDFLTVLDFIGNYKMASKLPVFLTGKENATIQNLTKDKSFIPDNCIIDFEIKLIDLLFELQKKNKNLHEKILFEYNRVKDEIAHIPSRTELFLNFDDEIYKLCCTHSNENIFHNYLSFLQSQNDLTDEENELYNSIAKDFLNLLENTSMTKVYKMPVLKSFIAENSIKSNVSNEELLESWKIFFNENSNWKDLDCKTFSEYKKISDNTHLKNIRKNPVNFLEKSGKGFFIITENGLSLSKELFPFLENKSFYKHFCDIIKYRSIDYYQKRYKFKSEKNYETEYIIPEPEYLEVADSSSPHDFT